MELSNEQRELLSAYLDGEVNASERALAQALLERNEAASYFESLKRVHDLAQKHGGARAPQNFAALVRQSLEGDFDGISRPTSNQGDYDGISRPTSNQAPIHALPQATWRMPLLAAAAAIVMALGIFTYNALALPTATPTGVALERSAPAAKETPRRELAAEEAGVLDDHNEETPATTDLENLKKLEERRRTHDEIEKTKKEVGPGEGTDAKGEKQGERYSRDNAEKAKENIQPGKDDDKNSTPDKSDDWRGEPGQGAGKTDKVGTGGGSGGGRTKDPAQRPDDAERKRAEGKPAESPPPPQPPSSDANPELKKSQAQPPVESARGGYEDAGKEITINVSKERVADSPSLETDVLQVASVYGSAKASSDDNGTSIEIEVSEDQVEEMVAALNQLTRDTDPAKDRTRANKAEADGQTSSEPARARDYLPRELRGAVERDHPKDAAENGAKEAEEKADQPKTAAPAPAKPTQSSQEKKKVRVVVRLK